MPSTDYSQQLLDALKVKKFATAIRILDELSDMQEVNLSRRSEFRGYTALHYAVLHEQPAILTKLLQRNPDTSIISKTLFLSNFARTALEKAVVESKWNLVAIFANFIPADPIKSSYVSALITASRIIVNADDPYHYSVPRDLIAKLIRAGVSPTTDLGRSHRFLLSRQANIHTPPSQLLMHRSILSRHISRIRACLAHEHADQAINLPDPVSGLTPLECAQELLFRGAPFDSTATTTGVKDITEALMRAGAIPSRASLIKLAKQNHWLMLGSILRYLRADVRPADFDITEQLLMHIAARADSTHARDVLRDHLSTGVYQTNPLMGSGESFQEFPISAAVRLGHWDAVKILAARPVATASSVSQQAALATAYGNALLAVMDFTAYSSITKSYDQLNRTSKIDLAIRLVDSGADCSLAYSGKNKMTALHFIVSEWQEAAEASALEVADEVDENPFTASAVENQGLAVLAQKVRRVSALHCSFKTKNSNGRTPLELAFFQNKPTMIAFLLNAGATAQYDYLIHFAKQGYWSCIRTFITYRSLEQRNLKVERQILKIAYQAKYSRDRNVREFITFLCESIIREGSLTKDAWRDELGHLLHNLIAETSDIRSRDIISLCRAGASKTILATASDEHSTPIVIAARQRKWDCVEALLTYNGRHVELGHSCLAMSYAIIANENDLVRTMLERGVPTAYLSTFTITDGIPDGQYLPLDVAIECGNTEAIQILLAAECHPNRTNSGKSPLKRAFDKDNATAIRLLLENNATPNTDAVMTAVEEGKWDCVKAYNTLVPLYDDSIWDSKNLLLLSHSAFQAKELDLHEECTRILEERVRLSPFITARSGSGMRTPQVVHEIFPDQVNDGAGAGADTAAVASDDNAGIDAGSTSDADDDTSSVHSDAASIATMSPLFAAAGGGTPVEWSDDSMRQISQGLIYEQVSGEGQNNCLFNAVRLHTDHKSANELREKVAEFLRDETNFETYRTQLGYQSKDSFDAYIESIESGQQPADDAVITVLQKILQRPIVVIMQSCGASIPGELFADSGHDPIFVCYKEAKSSYGGFRVREGVDARALVNTLRLASLRDEVIVFDYEQQEFSLAETTPPALR